MARCASVSQRMRQLWGLRARWLHVGCMALTLRLKVSLRREDHDDGGLRDVLFERVDGLQVVDVEEDGGTRQHDSKLPLDRGALILPGRPDVREKHVPHMAVC